MEDIKEQIRELLEGAKADKYAIYHDNWQTDAVRALNDYYYDQDRYEEEVYDTASDEWERLVVEQAQRGWAGVKVFLSNLGGNADWATLNGYGNAEEVTASDLLARLKEVRKELSHED